MRARPGPFSSRRVKARSRQSRKLWEPAGEQGLKAPRRLSTADDVLPLILLAHTLRDGAQILSGVVPSRDDVAGGLPWRVDDHEARRDAQIKDEVALTGSEVGVPGPRRHRLILLEHAGEVEVLEPIDIDVGSVLVEQGRG